MKLPITNINIPDNLVTGGAIAFLVLVFSAILKLFDVVERVKNLYLGYVKWRKAKKTSVSRMSVSNAEIEPLLMNLKMKIPHCEKIDLVEFGNGGFPKPFSLGKFRLISTTHQTTLEMFGGINEDGSPKRHNVDNNFYKIFNASVDGILEDYANGMCSRFTKEDVANPDFKDFFDEFGYAMFENRIVSIITGTNNDHSVILWVGYSKKDVVLDRSHKRAFQKTIEHITSYYSKKNLSF